MENLSIWLFWASVVMNVFSNLFSFSQNIVEFSNLPFCWSTLILFLDLALLLKHLIMLLNYRDFLDLVSKLLQILDLLLELLSSNLLLKFFKSFCSVIEAFIFDIVHPILLPSCYRFLFDLQKFNRRFCIWFFWVFVFCY